MSLKRLYRELARKFHPDLAETAVEDAYRTSIMAAVNAAYAAGDLRALYDLAGELEPGEAAELAGIESKRLRRLRQQIMTCRRRRRKVKQQYRALRRETTARLWQKAQEVAADDADWWSSVQRELEAAIARRRREIAELEQQAAALEEAGATVAWE
jgi:DnaJ-class molecular chaperone